MFGDDFGLTIGQPVNLIYGLKYGINTSDLFYPPSIPSIFTNAHSITEEVNLSTEFEAFPSITFCDNYTQLLQAFFHYLDPEDYFKAAGFMFQPGKEQETAYNLADLIGIHRADADLTGGSSSFVLARQWKRMANFTIQDKPKLIHELSQTLQNMKPLDTASLLNFYSSVGTHFIAGYTVGDFVYQAFAYEQSDYQMIKERYPTEESRSSPEVVFSFPRYTEIKTEFEGYAKYYGPVKIASADPRFETEIVPHLEDVTNVVNQSIFRLAANREIFNRLNDYGTEIIADVQLRNLEIFTTSDVSVSWLRLLQNSAFQKFGPMISPSFSSFNLSINYAEAYSQFTPLYPTMTATYLLGMKYLYLDLSSVQVLEPDKVKTVFLLADVIEISQDITLPGNTNVIIVCDVFISKSIGDYAPTLTVNVNPTKSKGFILITETFFGTMKLKSALDSSHSTLYYGSSLVLTESPLDDIMMVSLGPTYSGQVPNKTTAMFLYEDAGEIFRNDWVITSFQDGLGYFVECTENILNYNMGGDGPEAAFDLARWIVGSLSEPSIEADDESALDPLTNVYSRALVLLKTRNPERSRGPLFVPYLSYTMYKNVINSLVDAAEAYGNMADRVQQQIDQQRLKEEVAKNQDVLNQNIHNIAKFLLRQNKATQDQEEDLSKYYGEVVEDKQNSLKLALKQQEDLDRQLVEQQYLLDVEQQKLETAMRDKVTKDLFNTVIRVAEACADLFTMPAENLRALPPCGPSVNLKIAGQDFDNLKGLISLIKKVKKAIEAIKAFADLLKGALSGPPAINQALDNLNRIPFQDEASTFPTELDWYRFDNDVDNLMAQVPVPEAGSFQSAAKMYTAIGRQYTAISEQICQLQYAIATNIMQKYIHDNQVKRLGELNHQMSQTELSTQEAMNIDLFQLGTFLQSSQNRILMKVMNIMQEQDGALQYYTLQQPTPLTRYNILSIKDAIASRAVKALNAFEKFMPPPHELEQLRKITIPHVPFADLNGTGFNLQISLSTKNFYPYARVRITEVQAYINDVRTDSGQLFVNITGDGSLIYDRGLDRETLNYTTFPHMYPFTYQIDNGAIVAGNRIMGDDLKIYSLLTPFTQWNIQTPPKAQENRGIHSLSQAVSVTLQFRVNAIRHDAHFLRSDVDYEESDDSEATLVSLMSQAPMTYGWDVVSCVDAEKITQLFKEMYDKEDHSGLVYHINATHVSTNTSDYYSGTVFTGTVGPPLISFINNQPNMANLTMVFDQGNLVKSIILRNSTSIISNDTTNISYDDGTLTETHIVIVKGSVEVNTTKTEAVSDAPKIVGLMSLSKLIGTVTNQHDVIINLGKGVFDTKFTLDPNFDEELNDAVTDYFRTELANYNYSLGTVKFDTSNTPPALQPTYFEFDTLVPDATSRGVLLLFIKTNTSDSEPGVKLDLKLSANPIPSGRSATLIISNRLLMTHFILPEVQKQLTTAATASSPRPCDDPFIIKGGGTVKVNNIPVKTDDFRMCVADRGQYLDLTWNDEWKLPFSYEERVCVPHTIGCTTVETCDRETKFADMPVSVKASDKTPLNASINSSSSVITFKSFSAPVKVTFSPPKISSWQKFLNFVGGTKTDEEQEGKDVGESLKNSLNSISVSMSDVSVFAVSNLLFPGKKVINIQAVYLAQDLVLFGDVNMD